MALSIKSVEYFHATVRDEPGAAYRILSDLAREGVNLLAFNAVPIGPQFTQLVLFPDSSETFRRTAEWLGLQLTGPDHAFLVQGDDELGALAGLHGRLHAAGLESYASSGVTDGRGGFGYVLYVKAADFAAAAEALGA